ncbi:MAG: hypothetical protein F6J98_00080 [Moorea sp. SIO4G2]|nr:hypothetical protein [Moorena sp. SIO4G2]
MEQASLWNRHVAGICIFVERASCPFHFPANRMPTPQASWWNRHRGGTGIVVERASWWNRHRGGTGILPVSFSGLAIKYYGGQCIRQIIKLAKGFARHCPP